MWSIIILPNLINTIRETEAIFNVNSLTNKLLGYLGH